MMFHDGAADGGWTHSSTAFFLSYWAGSYQDGHLGRPESFYLGIYSLLTAGALISALIALWYATRACMWHRQSQCHVCSADE